MITNPLFGEFSSGMEQLRDLVRATAANVPHADLRNLLHALADGIEAERRDFDEEFPKAVEAMRQRMARSAEELAKLDAGLLALDQEMAASRAKADEPPPPPPPVVKPTIDPSYPRLLRDEFLRRFAPPATPQSGDDLGSVWRDEDDPGMWTGTPPAAKAGGTAERPPAPKPTEPQPPTSKGKDTAATPPDEDAWEGLSQMEGL